MKRLAFAAVFAASLAVSLPSFAHMPPPAVAGQAVPSLAPIVKRVSPAVVNVSTRGHVKVQQNNPFMNDPFFQQFFGGRGGGNQPIERKFQSLGSGVIVDADKGYILTNNHVIATATAGNGTIKVTLADGRTVSATVVGTDPSDDLAVLKVKLTGLTAATFASSSALQVGQTVVAVGAPLGLSDTVTAGIVSNTARPVTTGDSNNDQAVFNAVQTDAAINPGNSGGPLVNLNGDVVGINAAIATDQSNGGLQVPGQQSSSGNIGIGFAIPSDEAGRIATELIATGKATHAVLGVSVGGSNATQGSGAVIRSVTSGSPADKAGLRVGDVVTALAGQRIDQADALVAAVRSHAPGQQVKLTYTRGGSSSTVSLTLGESSG
jgi:putative serine protease PepD